MSGGEAASRVGEGLEGGRDGSMTPAMTGGRPAGTRILDFFRSRYQVFCHQVFCYQVFLMTNCRVLGCFSIGISITWQPKYLVSWRTNKPNTCYLHILAPLYPASLISWYFAILDLVSWYFNILVSCKNKLMPYFPSA